jgi:hypothetical protein
MTIVVSLIGLKYKKWGLRKILHFFWLLLILLTILSLLIVIILGILSLVTMDSCVYLDDVINDSQELDHLKINSDIKEKIT